MIIQFAIARGTVRKPRWVTACQQLPIPRGVVTLTSVQRRMIAHLWTPFSDFLKMFRKWYGSLVVVLVVVVEKVVLLVTVLFKLKGLLFSVSIGVLDEPCLSH